MAVAERDYVRTIPDDDRSATGQGWEARRRGLDATANPFDDGTWQHEHWLTGWLRYKPPGSASK